MPWRLHPLTIISRGWQGLSGKDERGGELINHCMNIGVVDGEIPPAWHVRTSKVTKADIAALAINSSTKTLTKTAISSAYAIGLKYNVFFK